MSDLGSNIRAEAARHRITQQQLAETLNTSQPAVSLLLAGKRRFRAEHLPPLADLFDCTTDYLLGRKARP